MLIQGNAVHIPLPDQSVHCAITSPPYWGLRKYSGSQGRIWGGDPECEHIWEGEEEFIAPENSTEEPDDRWASFRDSRYLNQPPFKPGQKDRISCGAWYGGLGLEPTPEQHARNIVKICREVRRVLRDDGVFWLNYGDCYGHGTVADRIPTDGRQTLNSEAQNINRHGGSAGNLMIMPHRVALALQSDGWIVRQDLVWSKPNPMPESINGWRWIKHRIKVDRSKHAADHNIKGGTQKMLEDASVHQGINEDWVPKYTDCPGCEKCSLNDGLVLKRGSWRHTRSHEFVFQLTKKMGYWSNQEAVRESAKPESAERLLRGVSEDHKNTKGAPGQSPHSIHQARVHGDGYSAPSGRNPRSVLDVPTAPYKGAHYATFPPNLIAPLIRATCPRWACPVCGQGWAAVVDKSTSFESGSGKAGRSVGDIEGKHTTMETLHSGDGHDVRLGPTPSNSVLGYKPTCEHPHTQEEAVPGIVFDPFVGSGTSVAVAQQLLRRGIGLDISRPYLEEQAKLRTGGVPELKTDDLPLFNLGSDA